MTRVDLQQEHTPEAIQKRLAVQPTASYVRDFIYGGIDGVITTFAIVAGVEGADLSQRAIIILGLANLVADGMSMAASNYTGTKSEVEDYKRLVEIERRHIALVPDGEREEVRQILQSKGLSGETLEEAVRAVTSNEERWINMMMAEEYGVSHTLRSPWYSAASTFSAFVLCGLVPLIPFLMGVSHAFELSIAATGVVFFAIGSARSLWSLKSWWACGLETFAIGCGAAGAAYLIGNALKTLV